MKLKVIEDRCSGCNVCRVICSLENFGAVQPALALIKVQGRFPVPGIYSISYCNQCGVCAQSCPEEAIIERNGEFHIDYERCSGCLVCVDSCPFEVMVIKTDNYPAKCTSCGKCVALCPREAVLADGCIEEAR